MANRRMLAASISVSEQVAALETDFARLLFTWMIAHADDYGVLSGSPAKVRALVVPMLDVTVAAVADALADMEENELIWRYLAYDAQPFIQFRTWETHQSGLHKRTAPHQPRRCDIPGDGEHFPELPGISRNFPLKGREQKGTEGEGGREGEDAPPPAAADNHHSDLAALTAQVVSECHMGKASQGGAQRIIASHLERGLTADAVLREVDKLVDRHRKTGRKAGISLSELDRWLDKARLVGPVPIIAAAAARASPATTAAASSTPARNLRTAEELSASKTPFKPRYPDEIDDEKETTNHVADERTPPRSAGERGDRGRTASLRAG